MNLLCIHQGFPGQYRHLLPRLYQKGFKIHVIGKPKSKDLAPDWISYHEYYIERGNSRYVHPLSLELESKIIRGEAVAIKAQELRKKGFSPDIIIGHPGWGEMLFLGDIWPNIPQLHYVEFFHGVAGTDDDFDGGVPRNQTWVDRARARMKNAHHLIGLEQMNQGVSPMNFQHSLLPDWAKQKTDVIHDGIDTKSMTPSSNATLTVKSRVSNKKITFKSGDPIITFINRTFEPYRGVHVFMKAVEKVQKVSSSAQVILVGEDTPNVSYGENRNDNIGWLTAIKQDVSYELDWSRIHHLGIVSHKTLRSIYQVSAAHVYLSYPFVLSWSMLEAMSCGCVVIGSSTQPVEEVIVDGYNGLLVPFTDTTAIANKIIATLHGQKNMDAIRKSARAHIEQNYELNLCLKNQISLISKLL